MPILAAFALPHPPIILPEVGRGQEKKIQKTALAYQEAMRRLSSFKPETIIVISPHSVAYMDYFHISNGTHAEGSFGQFNAPQVKISVNYDTELVGAIDKICLERNFPSGTMGERDSELDHGTMIPLYFLNKFYTGYKIIRIGLSGLPCINNYRLGEIIKEAVGKTNKRVCLIASGDLSHKLKDDGPYGFSKDGPVFDQMITDQMKKVDFIDMFGYEGDFLESCAECGLGSFQIMAGCFDKQKVTSDFLSYEGPFGVGYAVCCFTPDPYATVGSLEKEIISSKDQRLKDKKDKEDEYVRLARASLEYYIKNKKTLPMPDNLSSDLLTKKAGCFVSLKKEGKLRGCIGTISPIRVNLAHEIIENAISAGTEDPRFSPVEESELSELEYDVDVLSPFERVRSVQDLDCKKYGVIVQNGERRGLLLPDLSGVDSVQEQIEIAKQKAGIEENEDVTLYRFTVERHL
jgi:MEMO1 family protein